MKPFAIQNLSSSALLKGISQLVKKERKTQKDFLVFLGEIDRRRLYAVEGYSSLFSFVTQTLGLSESSALKRIQIARTAMRFPDIYSLVEENKVSLSALSKICPHLNAKSAPDLLRQVQGKSVREVEVLICDLVPREFPSDLCKPLAGERTHLSFVVDKSFMEKLQKVKARLSHKYPHGTLKDFVGDALEACLREKERAHESVKPRKTLSFTRHIPKTVKEEIWKRDKGRCAYISPSGQKCESTHFLEWDHIQPFAQGGKSDDSANVRLLCRTHNRLMADTRFGRTFIERKIAARQVEELPPLEQNRFLMDMWAQCLAGRMRLHR